MRINRSLRKVREDARIDRQEQLDWARTYYNCPYYQGKGECMGGMGCTSPSVMEPICQTSAPSGGWENVIMRSTVLGMVYRS